MNTQSIPVGEPGSALASHWGPWLQTGAWIAALSVVLGAVAAHGIDTHLATSYRGQTREIAGSRIPAAEKYLDDFKTASRYQMAHALGLMLIGIVQSIQRSRLLTAAAWSFLLGIILFCGSLYVLAVTAHGLPAATRHAIGLTAACGGISLIVGWCLFAVAACRCRRSSGS